MKREDEIVVLPLIVSLRKTEICGNKLLNRFPFSFYFVLFTSYYTWEDSEIQPFRIHIISSEAN
jgi:hypothetical protein